MQKLYKRLSYYAALVEGDLKTFEELSWNVQDIGPGADIIEKGDASDRAFIIVSGWAARYISLPDGRTQILNFMLPGDMFDLQVFLSARADHSVAAITKVTIRSIARRDLLALLTSSSKLSAAFWWATLQEEGILREQIVRNGRRSARERVAHLLLELQRRASIVGEGDEDSFRLPVSQVLIADALGLSFVHVNRVLRGFQREGMIDRNGEYLVLLDKPALSAISDFTTLYLHLNSPPRLEF